MPVSHVRLTTLRINYGAVEERVADEDGDNMNREKSNDDKTADCRYSEDIRVTHETCVEDDAVAWQDGLREQCRGSAELLRGLCGPQGECKEIQVHRPKKIRNGLSDPAGVCVRCDEPIVSTKVLSGCYKPADLGAGSPQSANFNQTRFHKPSKSSWCSEPSEAHELYPDPEPTCSDDATMVEELSVKSATAESLCGPSQKLDHEIFNRRCVEASNRDVEESMESTAVKETEYSLSNEVAEGQLDNSPYSYCPKIQESELFSIGERVAVLSWCPVWPDGRIREAQLEDNNISWIVERLVAKEKPPWREVLAKSAEIKTLWAQWDILVVTDGVLCKQKADDKHGRPVIPSVLRVELFRSLHAGPLGAHRGVTKVLEDLRSRFYWPLMKEDVQLWVSRCPICQSVKTRRPHTRANLSSLPVGNPMDRVQLDIVGPLPETCKGNIYILVLVDYFSKWAEAWSLPNHTAQTVADCVVTEFVCRFGTMLQLHTDQGREFESELFSSMCELLGVEKTRTTPYHPNSDGLSERVNQTLGVMLRAVCQEDREWDEKIPFLMAAYRASWHETIRSSPNKMMLGRNVYMPVDITAGVVSNMREPPCPIKYVEWLRTSM
jgi:hypothetical protein